MKILENIAPMSQDTETETSKLMWFSGQPYDLHVFNLESRSKTTQNIILERDLDEASCMCFLPDNKMLCCGSFKWKKFYKIYFIIDKDYSVRILPPLDIYMWCSATYYNNFAYICGDATVARFDLINWRWEKLIMLSVWLYSHTSMQFNEMILISAQYYKGIFVLDLLTLSFSSCQLEFEITKTRFLCKWENSAYLVDFSGKIYKSDNSNPFNWNFIGNCNPLDCCIYGHKTFYKDSLYFYGGSYIFKFDLNKMKLEKFDLPFY